MYINPVAKQNKTKIRRDNKKQEEKWEGGGNTVVKAIGIEKKENNFNGVFVCFCLFFLVLVHLRLPHTFKVHFYLLSSIEKFSIENFVFANKSLKPRIS